MEVRELAEVDRAREDAGELYQEFLRVPSMSAGLYVLEAGAEDPQTPHAEDEVYYVVSGRGAIRIGDEDHPVAAGSVVFVGKRVEHHFHSITERLQLLVVFAPAETG
jgi:mannose-6-phosphate isomerase-like protein (cupin superfamily)